MCFCVIWRGLVGQLCYHCYQEGSWHICIFQDHMVTVWGDISYMLRKYWFPTLCWIISLVDVKSYIVPAINTLAIHVKVWHIFAHVMRVKIKVTANPRQITVFWRWRCIYIIIYSYSYVIFVNFFAFDHCLYCD